MCNTPVEMTQSDGTPIMCPCRKCEECIAARKRSWIGRLNAEMATSDTVWFSTFTYGGGYDNDEAYWLNYRHLQLTFKKMRKAGHRFKYVAVGEYGAEKSRAHFHVLFFWQSEPPETEMGEIIEEWPYWDKGHCFHEYPRSAQATASYIMDYLDKDNLLTAELKFSRNPAIGTDYLLGYAKRHAEAGLSLFPEGATYTIPENKRADGKLFYYDVGRQTALYEKMLRTYLETWSVVRPDQKIPMSDDVQDFMSDTVCNLDREIPSVQQYVARNYGYEPQGEIPVTMYTTYELADGIEIQYGPNTVAKLVNQRGFYEWLRVLETVNDGNKELRTEHLEKVQRLRETDQQLKQLLAKRHFNVFIETRKNDHMSAVPLSSNARQTTKQLSAKEPPPPRSRSATQLVLDEFERENPTVR